MDRRRVIGLLAGLALPQFALSQATRSARVGYLAPRQRSVFLPGILKRLADRGFVEGKNLSVEYRSADGDISRFPQLARELIDAKCDLIFAVGTEHPAVALRSSATRIPIVLVAVTYDPSKAGIVANLGRPGGSITGVYTPVLDLAAKQLELLHQTLPTARRFLVLADSQNKEQLDVVRRAAARLRVQLIEEVYEVPPPYPLHSTFARAKSAGAQAVVALDSASFFDQRQRLSQLAITHRLPTVVNVHYLDQTGFLLGYGADFATAFARAGDIAAAILGGANPGEIPLEQPGEFVLIANLGAAKELGISIPASVLARANRVLE